MDTPIDVSQVSPLLQQAEVIVLDFGFKLVGAIVLWLVGRWLINLAVKLVSKAFRRQHLDPTIINYLNSALGVLLQVILIVAVLDFFGVETTSFAALLAAVGIAIGVAWSGMLANFVAGAFLVVFRPFNVGDFIGAGGVTGTVEEIGLCVTTINTLDNIKTIIGNNKVFSDNIQNFSANPYRRVDLVVQLNHSVDHNQAIGILKEKLSQIPNVLAQPAPDVEILEVNLSSLVLAVRPYCNNVNYWQVYFDTNKIIRESFGEAG